MKAKADEELSSLALGCLDFDAAAHELDNALGDGHAEPRSLNVAHRAIPGIGIKDRGGEFLAHAHARILDAQLVGGGIPLLFELPEGDEDAALFRRELVGIADEIQEHAVQPFRIAHNPAIRHLGGVYLVCDVLDIHLGDEEVVDIFHALYDICFCELQFHLTVLDAAHFQNVVDEIQKVLVGGLDLIEVVLCQRTQPLFLSEKSSVADDGIHGSAYVMAHVEEEGGLGFVALLCRSLLHLKALFPPHHEIVDVEHDEEGDEDEGHLQDVMPRKGTAYNIQLHSQVIIRILLFRQIEECLVVDHLSRIVVAEVLQNDFRRVMGRLAEPEHGGEENQEEEGNPADGGLSEAPLRIPLENVAEEYEAQDTPYDKDQVGLRGKSLHRPEAWKHEVEEKEKGDTAAEKAGHLHGAVALVPCPLEGDEGSIGIGDGGADGIDIHNPADCRSSEEGNGQGDQHEKEDDVLRGSLVAEFPKPFRKHVVSCHGVEKAAGADGIAHEAGDDSGDDGDAEDEQTGCAHEKISGMKGGKCGQSGQIAQILQIGGPCPIDLRSCQCGEGGKQDIGQGACDDSSQHDGKALFRRKGEFLRRVRYGLEACKGPWRQHHNAENGKCGIFFRRKRRSDLEDCGAVFREGGSETDEDAAEEDERHQGLEPGDKFPAVDADKAEAPKRRQGEEHFPKVDIIACDRIMESDLEGVPEKFSEDQGKRRGVRPSDGDEDEEEEPCAQETVVIAHGALGIGIGAAGIGAVVHHVVVVEPDDQHDDSPEKHADGNAQGTCNGEEDRSRHNEGSPSHGAAKSQRPGMKRRKIGT